MGQPNHGARIALLTVGGAFATAAWWFECVRWHLPPNDAAKGLPGPFWLLDPFVMFIAGPVALGSAGFLFPIAYACLRRARLGPSLLLIALVVGTVVLASARVSGGDVMRGFWPAYPATAAALVACRLLFSVKTESSDEHGPRIASTTSTDR